MWSNQEKRVRDPRKAVHELPAGTCLEGAMAANGEEQPMLEEQEEAARGLRKSMSGVEVHLGPCLFTRGVEPRGKKVVYFTRYHGHVEVAPLWEFWEDQQEQTQCIFHGNTWKISFLSFPLWESVEKARRNQSDFLLIQAQRRVTTLSTCGARSAHILPREWRRETTPHTLETRECVFIFSKHKTVWSGVTLQLTQECPVESNLKTSKKFIKYAKNMKNLCWKWPPKSWLPSRVMEDFE